MTEHMRGNVDTGLFPQLTEHVIYIRIIHCLPCVFSLHLNKDMVCEYPFRMKKQTYSVNTSRRSLVQSSFLGLDTVLISAWFSSSPVTDQDRPPGQIKILKPQRQRLPILIPVSNSRYNRK